MRSPLLALAFLALPQVVPAATLDLRTGAWELTDTTAVSGMPIPREALEKMPPEQRAKVEGAMKARAGKVTTHTHRRCVTSKDLERGEVLKSEHEGCTRKVLARDARHLDVQESCAAPDASVTHFRIDSKSPEHFTASIDRTQGEAQVHVKVTGRWLGATCTKGDED